MIIADDPQMEESIYQILPPQPMPVQEIPRHRSKFSGTTPPTASTFGTAGTAMPGVKNMAGAQQEQQFGTYKYKKPHAQFGRPLGSVAPDPQNILTGGSKVQRVQSLKELQKSNPQALQVHHVSTGKKMPPVPRRTEKPIMNLVSSKNFVTANAVENILSAPKTVANEVKDYLHKADYGRVPNYLKRVQSDIHEEYDYIQRLQDEEDAHQAGLVRPLQEEECDALIEGLKAKWEKVNTDYQATTHLTNLDTHGKVIRKEKYEATLSQIEKDLEKLNKRQILVDTQS